MKDSKSYRIDMKKDFVGFTYKREKKDDSKADLLKLSEVVDADDEAFFGDGSDEK